MGKIFCIMGKSSTGKDTIYKALLAEESLHLKRIIPYTTRPIRAGEQNGVEYYFTDDSQVQKLEEENKIIELRSYDTFYGAWKYFTVNDDQINLEKSDYLVIGTPESYLSMQKYFGKEKTEAILITLDDGIRLQRALNREKKQATPKYEEMCRRFLADAQDFAEDKIRECKITKSFANDDLKQCIASIKKYIQENR